MTKRANHYEAAFEALLRQRRVPYVAVDETRRALVESASLKSVDFIVSPGTTRHWLVDVKGRRFPAGRRRQYWRNWSTQDDLASLTRWQQLFGQAFEPVFVFAYNIQGRRSPLPADELFAFRGRLYGFVGIGLNEYLRHCRQISPRWATVAMPAARFRALAFSVLSRL